MHSDVMKVRDQNSKNSYADAHCHLIPEWFTMDEIKEIVDRSKQAQVDLIVNSAVDPEYYEFALETIKFESIYLTIGSDPTKISNKRFDEFTRFFKKHESEIIAIGEIGLDFHWVKEQEKQVEQEKFFRMFIDFARENDKPIVIHSREAESRIIEILKEKGAEEVLMHCFSGTESP